MALQPFVSALPPINLWVSEVKLVAFALAYATAHFGDDEDAFRRDSAERAEGLFHSPVYRALMAVATPGMLLRGASKRYATFHKGSTLSVSKTSSVADVTLAYPKGLFPEVFVRCVLCPHLEAPLRLSGAKDPSIALVACTDTQADMVARWR